MYKSMIEGNMAQPSPCPCFYWCRSFVVRGYDEHSDHDHDELLRVVTV